MLHTFGFLKFPMPTLEFSNGDVPFHFNLLLMDFFIGDHVLFKMTILGQRL